jgi:hypothetical protein
MLLIGGYLATAASVFEFFELSPGRCRIMHFLVDLALDELAESYDATNRSQRPENQRRE